MKSYQLVFDRKDYYALDNTQHSFEGARFSQEDFHVASFKLNYVIYDVFTRMTKSITCDDFCIAFNKALGRWGFLNKRELNSSKPELFSSISIGLYPALNQRIEGPVVTDADETPLTWLRAGRFLDVADDDPQNSLIITKDGQIEIHFFYRFMTGFIESITISDVTPA